MEKVTNPNRSQSTEALPKDFYKKNLYFFKICYTSVRYIKTLPQALGEQSITKTKRQKRTILQNIQKTNREQHLIQWKEAKAEFKSLAKKNKK